MPNPRAQRPLTLDRAVEDIKSLQVPARALADMMAGALRGSTAATLGLPGDIENLGRGALSAVRAPSGQRLDAFISGMEQPTVLPTSERMMATLPKAIPVATPYEELGQFAPLPGSATAAKALSYGAGRAAGAGTREAARAIQQAHLYGQGPLAPITPQVMKMDVWHGSPHRFPPTAKNPLGEFDPAKIGTGEGAQSYGHGHYTSSAKQVGKGYQPRSPEYEEKLIKMYSKAQASSNYPMMEVLEDAMLHRDPEEILQKFASAEEGYTPAHQKAAQEFAKWYEKNPPEVGSLYRVDLSDEAIPKMLDWNANFESQHPDVQSAVLKYWSDNPALRHYGDPTKMTGEGIYGSVKAASLGPEGVSRGNLNPSNEAASMDLRHYGIPGIKYLDESHRTSSEIPEGVTNFVVFPGKEELLNIVERKAAGGVPKPPSDEIREKLRQLRDSFVPLANEAERQKKIQDNLEKMNKKISFSDNPDSMMMDVEEAQMAGGGAAPKLLRLLRAPAKTKEEIRAVAERVAPQMTGEFVRGEKGTQSVAGKTQKQVAREKEIQHEIRPTKETKTPEKIDYEKLKDQVVIGIPGDPTITGQEVVSVAGQPLQVPSPQHGGPLYGLHHDDAHFWASQLGAARRVQNLAKEAGEQYGQPVLGQYIMMGPESINYAQHFADANLQAIDLTKMRKSDIEGFNKLMRKGSEASGPRPTWPGIENPEEAYLQMSLDPELRKHFNALMQMPTVTERFNLPSGIDVRHAVTEPELRNLETGVTGFSVGQMRPDIPSTELKLSEHPTYSHDIPGHFLGQSQYPIPYEIMFPDTLKAIRENPKQAAHEFGSLKMIGPRQTIDQQMIDEIRQYEEMMKSLTGKKKGGQVKKAAGGEITAEDLDIEERPL